MARISGAPCQLSHLDALRVIASVAIVVLHFGATAFGDRVGRLHLEAFVDVFFVISGAVMHHVYRGAMSGPSDYGRFMVKRIARLYPLHLATLAVFVAIGLAVSATGARINNPEVYDWRSLLPNALLIHALGFSHGLSFNGPSWSISAEMGCYLLLPAFLLIGRGRMFGAVCLAGLLAVAMLAFHDGRPWYGRTVDGGVLRAAVGFGLGVWLYGQRGALGRVPGAGRLFWLALAGMLVSTALPSGYPAIGLGYLVAALALACDASAEYPGGIIRRLAPLGALTYSLYLLHPVVQAVALDFAAKRVLHLSGGPMLAAVIASAAVTATLSIASYRYFEQPARAWVMRLLAIRKGARVTVLTPAP